MLTIKNFNPIKDVFNVEKTLVMYETAPVEIGDSLTFITKVKDVYEVGFVTDVLLLGDGLGGHIESDNIHVSSLSEIPIVKTYIDNYNKISKYVQLRNNATPRSTIITELTIDLLKELPDNTPIDKVIYITDTTDVMYVVYKIDSKLHWGESVIMTFNGTYGDCIHWFSNDTSININLQHLLTSPITVDIESLDLFCRGNDSTRVNDNLCITRVKETLYALTIFDPYNVENKIDNNDITRLYFHISEKDEVFKRYNIKDKK